MGLLTDIFDFLLSYDGTSYINSAKVWGDDVWRSLSNVHSGLLSLIMIDDRLYKHFRIEFRNGNIGVYTDSKDKGWEVSSFELKKMQRKQLKEEGEIIIKRYK